jgi:hypothetical protein
MIDVLIDLPAHQRARLVAALESGQLAAPFVKVSLRSALGAVERCDELIDALNSLQRMGMTGPACAAWIRTVVERDSRRPRPDLVWSGPEVPGLHARNTRQVYEELLGSAERSVWASSYAFFDGPKAFEVLAKRMDQQSGLHVTLFLNIQRRKGDTSVRLEAE